MVMRAADLRQFHEPKPAAKIVRAMKRLFIIGGAPAETL